MEMMGTTTGRMSQTNPDLQAIPGRPDLVKKKFMPQADQKMYTCAREEFYRLYVTYNFEWQKMPKEKEEND